MAASEDKMIVSLPYLSRDSTYLHEKPYAVDFDVSGIPGAKPTNHIIEFHSTLVRNGLLQPAKFTLQDNGFEFLKEKTSIDQSNAVDVGFLAQIYIFELMEILRRNFPEYREFRFVDYQVRKRSESFPEIPGAETAFAQPASLPHCDFSTRGSLIRLAQVLPEEKRASDEFDLINVWQVIAGPNNDWPLALCDAQSVHLGDDVTPNDVLHETSVGENMLLYHNNAHLWYYIPNQQVDDLIVFRNSNSKSKRAISFHAAVDTGIPGLPPRQSIETRFAAFW
ncbi:hypothetical protein F5B20DRAFT_415377 [Whalleya microplaca]|nr:hypothetical protein F5B20DRAFT_415377 [Whalleya microplaca]